MRRHLTLLAVTSALLGCGEDSSLPEDDEPPSSTCADPLDDGTCLRPGMAADDCVEGFEHDGAYSCVPILPAEPCPPAMMAIPGDEVCRPIMECGAGVWGDLPVDATTQYVDASYGGNDSDGTADRPWIRIGDAVAAAEPMVLVAVAAGLYVENVVIVQKPIRLWGVCPDLVTIQNTGVNGTECPAASICVAAGAEGTVIGGVTLTGSGIGLGVFVVDSIRLERSWIHGARFGIEVSKYYEAPAGLTVEGSRLSNNVFAGVHVAASRLEMHESVVEATQPLPDQTYGRGINVDLLCEGTAQGTLCDPTTRSVLDLRRSVVSDNHEFGISIKSADAIIEGSVVRRTRPEPLAMQAGRGISIYAECREASGEPGCTAPLRSSVVIRDSHLAENHDVGVLAVGSDMTMERTTVRTTWPQALDLKWGYGVQIQEICRLAGGSCYPEHPAIATVTDSVITDSHAVGLFVNASQLTMKSSIVSNTHPEVSTGLLGRGINAQLSCTPTGGGAVCDPDSPSIVAIDGSWLADNHDIGLAVGRSEATVTSSRISHTMVREDGLSGDGISVYDAGTTTLRGVEVLDSARAGVGSFASSVSLESVRVACAAFELTREEMGEVIDLGDNRCGCPEAAEECKVVSAGLEPPQPVEPP